MLGGKVTGRTFGFAVDNEIDVPLAEQHHIFGAVFGHQREAHALKQRLQHAGRGRGEFNKLKPHQPHGVFKQIGHGASSSNLVFSECKR